MLEGLIGTAGVITSRRGECEEAISQLCGDSVVEARVIADLRRQFGNELADLVVSAAELQKKARKKLGPGLWWVTTRSLQQATAWQVAQLKSSWFGDRLVYDLCCGIGGDAVCLARRGRLVAVDLDATMVEMASANLIRSGAQSDHAFASCGDASTIKIPRQSAIHMDPDRRVDGRKSRPDDYQPSWTQVLEIIAKSECAVVKLAPAAKFEATGLGDAHRCWISLQGTVREQSLLRGEAMERAGVTANTRSAVALASDGSASWFCPRSDDLAAARIDAAAKPLSVMIDPDPSIRAAGLTEKFAQQHNFKLLGSPSGFLTCEDPESITSAAGLMAVMGRVTWSGACDDRKLRREFRRLDVYPERVKVRGTDHDPAALAKRYRKCGDQPVTLWIGRAGDRVVAAITT
jgi:SAM-dependent methyltransferase